MYRVFGRRAIAVLSSVVVACVIASAAAPTAYSACNSRDGAKSYMNTARNLNSTPGNAYYFSVDKGTGVWMDGWNGGPSAMGQNKWFRITVRTGPRYGAVGWVPAPSVSNQWNCSPFFSY